MTRTDAPTDDRARCAWANGSPTMVRYHDEEWGRPAHDDRYLFEMLVLEGAQAGLSWSTVLNKRENYRAALDDFAVAKIAEYGQDKLDDLLTDAGIVRNRLKIASLVKNARGFLAVREEFGSFDAYLWQWTGGVPVVSRPGPGDPPLPRTELSDRISKDLKKRGFTFVGTTITYAYLQGTGVVDDHAAECWVAAAGTS
ncbi:DNA-3-methyladenine glycosylase I [Streptomyces tsukubensis]|uniref:DNA-3-methyladenine glycosylase n=1 Tax=Streptomyces tsukubensis TaxID=83656 RepID=A0A1V4A761_9ACTN|nr:DNA-3-methyladenine glycosylase I [Streptomyces tsukubensis]OON77287.1 DNA-3-methyladenine glycosylase [Streptomyces tsukubensis]QFR92361.1 DNA-3-methyladenine glycosylase I [Streptomyces tsukubensis]